MKEDKRIINSRNKIESSFINCMMNKTIDEITINEICNEANINRSTFYEHYLDKNDLYKEIETMVTNKISESFDDKFMSLTLNDGLKHLYTFIHSHKHEFIFVARDYYKSNAQLSLFKIFSTFVSMHTKYNDTFFLHFVFWGFINTSYEWVISDYQKSVEEMVIDISRILCN
ncbi:MAG: TetR family transcriptional regulator [Coprobacillus sp.]|nr:TetR family transcriptional regulator [Coprobacillus sp.]CCY07328.1 tetR family HTH transcriptional regulator [Coprobacillus sp. CAG:698]